MKKRALYQPVVKLTASNLHDSEQFVAIRPLRNENCAQYAALSAADLVTSASNVELIWMLQNSANCPSSGRRGGIVSGVVSLFCLMHI